MCQTVWIQIKQLDLSSFNRQVATRVERNKSFKISITAYLEMSVHTYLNLHIHIENPAWCPHEHCFHHQADNQCPGSFQPLQATNKYKMLVTVILVVLLQS